MSFCRYFRLISDRQVPSVLLVLSTLLMAFTVGAATGGEKKKGVDADLPYHVEPQYPGWYPGKYPDLKRKHFCKPEAGQVSTPTERFVLSKDGTALDKATGLMWMRCSLGHTWTGDTCEGDTHRSTWKAALDAVVELNDNEGFAGHSDWRIPDMKELGSIVERTCMYPTINMEVFPTTELWYYWASTPSAGLMKDYEWNPKRQWGIDFGDGKDNAANFTKRRLRLVRDPK